MRARENGSRTAASCRKSSASSSRPAAIRLALTVAIDGVSQRAIAEATIIAVDLGDELAGGDA